MIDEVRRIVFWLMLALTGLLLCVLGASLTVSALGIVLFAWSMLVLRPRKTRCGPDRK